MRTVAATCLALALASSAARAQTSLDAELSRGVALRRDGRDEAALAVFEAAWRASRSPRAQAQIALAEQALGRWVDAEAHLVAALESAGDPWVRSHLAVLQSALAEIRLHVGRLDVQGHPAGAEVVIEGRVVGTLPLAAMLRVPTGSLTFTVRREGYIPATRTVQVEGRYPLREGVSLAPLAPAAQAPSLPDDPDRDRVAARTDPPRERAPTPTLRYVGYGLIVTGAAALVTSGVFTGLNLVAAGEAGSATPTSPEPYGAWARFQASENVAQAQDGDAQCATAQQRTGADAEQVRDLCARVSTSATVALATGIAGVVLTATGVVLAVVARPSAPPRGARWSVGPWVALGRGGAIVTGHW